MSSNKGSGSNYHFRLYSTEPGHEQVKALASQSGNVSSAWHARAEFAALVLSNRREQPTAQTHCLAVHQRFLNEHRDGHIELLLLTENGITRLEPTLPIAPPDIFLPATPLFGLEGINKGWWRTRKLKPCGRALRSSFTSVTLRVVCVLLKPVDDTGLLADLGLKLLSSALLLGNFLCQ